jgi:hypothetical protein
MNPAVDPNRVESIGVKIWEILESRGESLTEDQIRMCFRSSSSRELVDAALKWLLEHRFVKQVGGRFLSNGEVPG